MTQFHNTVHGLLRKKLWNQEHKWLFLKDMK